MSNFTTKKVLIVPLDWGLGHATRCIPLIRSFLENGWKVQLGAEGAVASLLRAEFPDIHIHPIPGYRVTYTENGRFFLWKMLIQLPRLLYIIYAERRWLQKLLNRESYDLVVSDNRYGLYHKSTPSVIITHQLRIQLPIQWMEDYLEKVHSKFIKRFDACWIPDVKGGQSLAGQLSHTSEQSNFQYKYLGLLSRYTSTIQSVGYQFEFCFLISGPEPQRAMLEQAIRSFAKEFKKPSILFCGQPGELHQEQLGELVVRSHALGRELLEAIQQSRFIVARSGYTTMMEMAILNKQCIFIPTPGQTEQEYLAQLHNRKGYASFIRQEQLNFENLSMAAQELQSSWPSYALFTSSLLKELTDSVERKGA